MGDRFETITFLSDYGTRDEFVGVVKSVIRSIAPAVEVIDLTHEIQPYDVRAGALTLGRAAQYLCPGVVLAVVDPGVGTERRAVAVEVGGGQSYLVGPDNGLLASAVAMSGGATAAVELVNPDFQLSAPGPTFAGRDVFAPAAAHLCTGVPLDAFGPAIDPLALLPGLMPIMREEGDLLVAEVLWVDHYGNLQLNLDPDDLEGFGASMMLTSGDLTRRVERVSTFDEISPRGIGLFTDSYGLLALAVARGSAADDLRLGAADQVRLSDAGDAGDSAATTVSTPVALGRRPEGTA